VSASEGASRREAAASLMLARVVYAFNWYNIGAVLPLIGKGLRLTTPELGIVVGSFLVGAAIFQIPAGFSALRWGNRTVSIFALFLMGTLATASAFSPNWVVLSVLRFGTGAGAAFFFAPALGLLTSYYPAGTRGPVIGLYNSGFSIGSGVGLFGGAFLGAEFGWPLALLVGGLGLLACAAIAPPTLPRIRPPPQRRSARELWFAAIPVLRSRSLWALSIATAGLWAAYYVAAQYFIQFASAVHPGWSVVAAAGIPTVMIVLEIPGGPIGGALGERQAEMRRGILGWGIASGIALVLVPYLSLDALVGLFAFLGFADGVVFALLYLLPSYLPEGRGESLSLGLTLLNSIQIFLGSALAIGFAYIVGSFGYTAAWWFTGAIALAPLPLLAWVSGRRGPVARPAVPRPEVSRAIPVPSRPE
jgi:MFS transporter, ACDE family, multidrug resistance protein